MGNPYLYLLWIENLLFVYQNILGTRIAETHPPFLSRCWSVHLDRHMFCQRRALRREHSCETNGTASYEFVAQFLGEKEVEEEGGRKMKREREGGGRGKKVWNTTVFAVNFSGNSWLWGARVQGVGCVCLSVCPAFEVFLLYSWRRRKVETEEENDSLKEK